VNAFGLSPHSGSIDEGIADYFACSQNGDPIVGEASLAPLNAERDLTNTAKVCPDDVFGEVHEDGEIIGSVSWSVRDALGAANADKIVWGAVAAMPPGGTLGDFGRGLVSTTEALVGDGTLTSADLTTVQGIVAARGLDDCDEVIAIDAGETKKVDVIGLDLIGQILGGSCAQAQNFGVEMQSLFHFSHKPAATDTALRFTVDVKAMGGGGTDLTLYVRKGQNVTFKSSGFLPVVDKFDYSAPVTSNTGEIVIDASSDPPFDPNAEYFFILTSKSCPTLNVTVGTSNEPVPVGTGGGGVGGGGTGGGGGGVDPDTVPDDGCGCAVAGYDLDGRPLGLVALGAGLLALRARRRRRPSKK
jgi:MYXO-CTERM domain-containing protein